MWSDILHDQHFLPDLCCRGDHVVRWVFVSVTIVGFVLLDIAYTAVVVNYCIQCQLIIYLTRSISERTKAKEWDIDKAIKVWEFKITILIREFFF